MNVEAIEKALEEMYGELALAADRAADEGDKAAARRLRDVVSDMRLKFDVKHLRWVERYVMQPALAKYMGRTAQGARVAMNDRQLEDAAFELENYWGSTVAHMMALKLSHAGMRSDLADQVVKEWYGNRAMRERLLREGGTIEWLEDVMGGRIARIARRVVAFPNVLDTWVDMHGVEKLQGKMDTQTYDLAVDVWAALQKAVALTPNQWEALNRLKSSVDNSYSRDMHRNNIFKAAHALGIKLPSSMF